MYQKTKTKPKTKKRRRCKFNFFVNIYICNIFSLVFNNVDWKKKRCVLVENEAKPNAYYQVLDKLDHVHFFPISISTLQYDNYCNKL